MKNEQASEELKKRYGVAETLLHDPDKMERFLQRLEKKLTLVPLAGETLATMVTLISLVRCYIRKEYPDVPLGTIIAIVAALVYFVSPIDLIPDTIPVAGYIDDAAVIATCMKLVNSDVEEFKRWRKNNGREILV